MLCGMLGSVAADDADDADDAMTNASPANVWPWVAGTILPTTTVRVRSRAAVSLSTSRQTRRVTAVGAMAAGGETSQVRKGGPFALGATARVSSRSHSSA